MALYIGNQKVTGVQRVGGVSEWGDITGTLSNQTDLQNALNAKQGTLVSGVNIKTVDGKSILGEGNLATPFRNIGEIFFSTIPVTDAGAHLLDGSQIVGGGIYNDFVEYIANLYGDGTNIPNYFCTESEWQTSVTNYGVCGKFVYDSTNNIVRLPKITGIIEGTTDASALGDLVEAGLPNITGEKTGAIKTDGRDGTNGCIKWTDTSTAAANGGYYGWGTLSIDASLSNPIYGNSQTVQPQTIKVLYYIVIATTTKTDIQVDIDEIATDLNGKADIDLSNTAPTISFATAMNTVGIRTVVETYQNGTSWYRVYSDGWCEQGDSAYVASSRTIYLLKAFASTNYNVSAMCGSGGSYAGVSGDTQTTTSFYLSVVSSNSWNWMACGYIS